MKKWLLLLLVSLFLFRPGQTLALSVTAVPATNIVSETGIYAVVFTTGAAETIKTVEMTFPAGFVISGVKMVEVAGLNPGTFSVSGQVLTYTVTSEVNVPGNQEVRIIAGSIKNGTSTAASTLTVKTKNAVGVTIEGPAVSNSFTLIKVNAGMLANNSVNSTKIVDGSITTADLADGAVTGAKILPTAIGPSQLSNNSIWSTHILDGTIATGDLAFDPATQAELDTHKGSTDHDGRYIPKTDLNGPGTINSATNPVDWTKLKNVPSGFADGIDDAGGGASGWTDDGIVVRLTTITDNVGIGTTTPSQKLEVVGNVTLQNNGKLGFNNDLSGELRSIKLRSYYLGDETNAGTIAYRPSWDSSSLVITGAGTGVNRNVRIWDSLTIGYSTPGAGTSAAFSGNVGIGTTNPGEKLEIGGSGNLLLKASTEDPGDIIFHNSAGIQKGRIWSSPIAGSSLYLSSGDNIPDVTIDANGKVTLNNGIYFPTAFGARPEVQNGNVLSFGHPGVSEDQIYYRDNTFYFKDSPGGGDTADPTVEVGVLRITGGADLAEPFDIENAESIRPGMVVVIDADNPGNLRIADRSYDHTVAGIVSGANGINPGLVMKDEGTEAVGSHPVALTGRVYTWVDASNGPIQPGDLLTTSDTPGHAMKATDHAKAQGAIIGKAMTSLKEGKGLVLVLVTLQ